MILDRMLRRRVGTLWRRDRGFDSTLDYIRGLPSKRPFVLKLGIFRRQRSPFVRSIALGLPLAGTNRVMRGDVVVNQLDKRVWHPLGRARPISLDPRASELIAVDPDEHRRWEKIHRVIEPRKFWWTDPATLMPGMELSPKLGFRRPSGVWDCVKRKVRREVLHALGFVGAEISPKDFKKRVLTESSMVRC